MLRYAAQDCFFRRPFESKRPSENRKTHHHDRIHVHPFGIGAHLRQRPFRYRQIFRRTPAQAQTYRASPHRIGGRLHPDRRPRLYPRIPRRRGTPTRLGVLRYCNLPLPDIRLPLFRMALFLARTQPRMTVCRFNSVETALSDGLSGMTATPHSVIPVKTGIQAFEVSVSFQSIAAARRFSGFPPARE